MTIEYVAEVPYIETMDQKIDRLIKEKAWEYSVSEAEMRVTIKCESSFNPNAWNKSEDSIGLAQIHMPTWGKEVSREQAYDPEFAIDFMAKHFSQGNQKYWTCWKMNYDKTTSH